MALVFLLTNTSFLHYLHLLVKSKILIALCRKCHVKTDAAINISKSLNPNFDILGWYRSFVADKIGHMSDVLENSGNTTTELATIIVDQDKESLNGKVNT